MADIWVISDTHFDHYNMVHRFKTRPFESVSEMDEKLIYNWNSVVKPEDKVYHLGDVAFGDKTKHENLLRRLNGKKRLIVGNHDDVKHLSPFFEKVMLWRQWKEFGLLFTHVPVHESTLKESRHGDKHRSIINVHGHIHSNASPVGPYRCVCVEQINYTPVNIEELRQ